MAFGATVAWRLGRPLPGLGLLAAIVSLACLVRLLLELSGRPRAWLESVAPLSFVVLVAVLGVLSLLGILRQSSPGTPAGEPRPASR